MAMAMDHAPRSLPRHQHPAHPPHAPLLPRLLSALLPLFAALLLLTTLHLFHLHHSHHNPEDDASDLDKLGRGEAGGASSPGGAALRHKMGLAQFLLQKYEQDATAKKGDVQDAMQMGWKGGDEENFIRMVEEARQGAAAAVTTTPVMNETTAITSTTATTATSTTKATTSTGDYDYNYDYNDDTGKTKNATTQEEDEYAATLPRLNWQQLQHILLEEKLLPPPIPPTRTARGFSGLPAALAPALEGARRGTIACPDTDPRVGRVLSSALAFWNDPRGTRDREAGRRGVRERHAFVPPPLDAAALPPWTPGRVPRRRYLTFEPDTGGWNNLRISFENVLVLAAATGRTLVLPPDQVMYLLEPREGSRPERNYYDLLKITDNPELLRRVPILTAREFLRLEGGKDGLVPLAGHNATWREHLVQTANSCEERRLSDVYCEDLYDHYRNHGQVATVTSEGDRDCFVFDANVFRHGENHVSKLAPEILMQIQKFCRNRTPVYYNRTVHEAVLWHFETMDLDHRLLVHSYAFLLFTDPWVGNYYKRFVRDFLRFHDTVYCAAGKIILALQYEDYLRNKALNITENGASSPLLASSLDLELVGGYSSMHVRRGDLQFTEVKFNSSKWYDNTKELWKLHEVLYITTDESDRSWFDSFRAQHSGPLRFFGDYRELADLDSVDPTLYGMIETVVASRASVFAGTWFSTFSGYIIRLRGYYGMSKHFSYYSWLKRKYFMNSWMDVGDGSYYAREYPGECTVASSHSILRCSLGFEDSPFLVRSLSSCMDKH